MIHRRTQWALGVAMFGGAMGGYLAGATPGLENSLLGWAIAFSAGIAGLWLTPHAETVAIQWREHQRVESEQEGSA